MTEAEVLQLINDWIVANGNNEITADVLRPILVAMVEQPNDFIGVLSQLQTADQTNLVNAINEVYDLVQGVTDFGLQLHSGTADPNVIPPSQYNIADFYIQRDLSNNPIDLWQYNGTAWIKSLTIGQIINDDITSLDSTWSSEKIESEIGSASDLTLQEVTDNGATTTVQVNLNGGLKNTAGANSVTIDAGNKLTYSDATETVTLSKSTPQEDTDINIALPEKSGVLVVKDDVVLRIGTEVGKPITGDLEIRNEDNPNYIYSGDLDNNSQGLRTWFDDNSFELFKRLGGLDVSTVQLGNNEFRLNMFDPTAKGIVGNTLFDKDSDPNAFAQLGDLSGFGSGTVTSVTGTTNEITVASGTTTPLIGISSSYTTARDSYADSKVAQTITNGVTDSAPSQDVVFDNLALKAPINNASMTGSFTLASTTALVIIGGVASNVVLGNGSQLSRGTVVLNQVLTSLASGSNTPITTSSTVVTALADLQAQITPIVNTTTVGLSSAALNSTYPNVPVGTRVICPNITLGGAIYVKATEAGSSDVWLLTSAPVAP